MKKTSISILIILVFFIIGCENKSTPSSNLDNGTLSSLIANKKFAFENLFFTNKNSGGLTRLSHLKEQPGICWAGNYTFTDKTYTLTNSANPKLNNSGKYITTISNDNRMFILCFPNNTNGVDITNFGLEVAHIDDKGFTAIYPGTNAEEITNLSFKSAE